MSPWPFSSPRWDATAATEAESKTGADDGAPDGGNPLERAAITVENLSHSFGDLAVLEDVSLSVEPGEFVGLVGPNGSGKTTLLRAISAALEPDSGAVRIGDTDVHAVSSRASSRLVSVVPQDTTLSFSFPVRDVVEMGRHPHRSRFSAPTPADREAVEEALERTRTAELADRPIDEISGGQRQRVVLARAIAQETPALLLDEPTASLDVNHQLETLELVRELVEEGRTICAAIHDLELAARYCDRLVMLADGSVYRSGPPGDVLTGDSLADVFDATAAVTTNPITGTETVTALPNDADLEIGRGDGERGEDVEDGGKNGGGNADEEGDGVRIHVLGSGSTAAGVLARLETAAAGLELSFGPVTAGDAAAEIAGSLGIDRLEVAPFESLSPADLTAFEESVRAADVTVVTENVLERAGGPGTRRLLEVIDATADSVVVVAGSDGETARTTIDAASRAAAVPFPDRGRTAEATPETVLEVVADESPRSIDAASSAD